MSNKKEIKVVYLNEECKLKKGTDGAMAFDVCANIEETLVIKANTIVKVPLGIKVDTGDANIGCWICSRSGLSSNYGLMVVNGFGLVDSDYRGEICAVFYNTGVHGDVIIEPNQRVAQVVFMQSVDCEIKEVTELDVTERGEGGFGSTGTK